jgi:hypothetical protein
MNVTWQLKFVRAIRILTLLSRVLKAFWQVVACPSLFYNFWQRQYYYIQHRTNFHKHPVITRFLCWMGRHDYEAESYDGNQAMLYCFYCLQKKGTSIVSSNEDKASSCHLQKTDDGSYILSLTSPLGNESWYVLNHHQHAKGVPSKVKYSTGDTCWFNPDGSVRLVLSSTGKYWK